MNNQLGDFLTRKYLEYQLAQGKKVYAREFAAWLGVPPTSYSNWVNAGFTPSGRHIDLLADKLGYEVYDILGRARPGARIMLDPLPKELQDALEGLVKEMTETLAGVESGSAEEKAVVRKYVEKLC